MINTTKARKKTRSGKILLGMASAALIAIGYLPLDCQVLTSAIDLPSTTSGSTLVKATSAINDYVIGPDDVLAINVWKEPEISRSLPVRPDGKISLPLVGDLLATGRTPVELQNEIRQRLLTYLSDPQVTVVLQEAKSHKFNIVGEVEKPGSYVMSNPMTVLDAIAIAGGLKDFAKSTKIYVLRANADGLRVRLPFNYKKVLKGGDLRQNVQLEPSDTVVVP